MEEDLEVEAKKEISTEVERGRCVEGENDVRFEIVRQY